MHAASRLNFAIALLVAFAAYGVRPAEAQSQRRQEYLCLNADLSSDPAIVIQACDAAITDGLLDDNHEFAIAQHNRGTAHYRLGQLEEALRSYDRAIHIYPFHAGFFSNRSNARRRSGDREGALADLNEAVRLEPSNPVFLNMRGDALVEMSRYVEAISDYDAANRLAPHNADYRNDACFARTIGSGEQFEQALVDCDTAVRLAPTNGEFLALRGVLHLRRASYQASADDFAAALQRTPQNARARYGYGIALNRLGQTEQGRQELEAAMAADAGVSALYQQIGLAP